MSEVSEERPIICGICDEEHCELDEHLLASPSGQPYDEDESRWCRTWEEVIENLGLDD